MMCSDICSTAMILSAGFGKRLHPLTLGIPKPLIRIGGETLLDYHMRNIQQAGFTQAIINTHYLAEKIEDHLKTYATFAYQLSYEKDILETGGGISNALHHLDKPFLSVNCDAYTTSSLPQVYSTMMDTFDPDKMDVLLLLVPTKKMLGYQGKGDFFMQRLPSDRLTFRDDKPFAPYVYTGIQMLHPGAFVGWSGAFPIPELWKKCEENKRFWGLVVETEETWFDTGNLEGLGLARDFSRSCET